MAPSTSSPKGALPIPVCVVVGEVIGLHYFRHRIIDSLFAEAGAPGQPPEGSCVSKAQAWLRLLNDSNSSPLDVLGAVLERFMEVDETFVMNPQVQLDGRVRMQKILAAHNLAYVKGGKIVSSLGSAPVRQLEDILRARDLKGINVEFDRALANVHADPPAAVTASCAILEAFFKIYLEDEGIPLPNDKSVMPLWKTVSKHMKLTTDSVVEEDLRRVLQGLTSIIDGIGAFRTHAGSAHGGGRARYRPLDRHARLTINAAHTLVAFLIETWGARKAQPTGT